MSFVVVMIPMAQYIHTKWYNTSDEFSKLASLNVKIAMGSNYLKAGSGYLILHSNFSYEVSYKAL